MALVSSSPPRVEAAKKIFGFRRVEAAKPNTNGANVFGLESFLGNADVLGEMTPEKYKDIMRYYTQEYFKVSERTAPTDMSFNLFKQKVSNKI